MSDPSPKILIVTVPKFPLGHLVSTPNALSQLTQEDISGAIQRHASGDWGECDSHDWASNERALKHGGRLFSVYLSEAKDRFWVITEADRSSTCVLMPSDY